MSQIDDFLSGRRPQDEETSGSSIDAFLSGGQPQKKKRERRESQATAGDYARAIESGLAEGIVNLTGGVGTFIQDPAANTLSGVIGASHLADRGITWLLNKAGVDAEVNPTLQDHARMASRFAAESRDAQANDPTNLPARAGRYLQEDSERAAREIKARDEATNPELIAQQQNMGQAEGFMDNLAAIKDNPLAFTRMLSRSAPDMALGVGVGATLHRAGAGLGTVSTAGTLAEAGSSAMQGRQGVYQAVMDLPMDALMQSPRYQEVLKEAGGDRAKARQILANELADQVPLLTGAGTAMGTVLTNRLFGGDSTAKTIVGAERMTAKEFGKRTLQDTVEEGVQGVPEDTVQYGATVQADPNQEYDPGGSLAQNLAAGLAMGAGGHGYGYVRDNMGRLRRSNPAAPAPDEGGSTPAFDGARPTFPPAPAVAAPAAPAPTPAAASPAATPAADPTARLAELEILSEQRDLTPAERQETIDLLTALQDEQDAPQGSEVVAPQAPAVEAPEATGGDGAAAAGVPAEPSAPNVEAAGLEPEREAAKRTNFWTWIGTKGYKPADVKVGTPLHAELKAEFDALRNGQPLPSKAQPAAPSVDPVAAVTEWRERFPAKPPSGMSEEQLHQFAGERSNAEAQLVQQLEPQANGLVLPTATGFGGITQDPSEAGKWRITRFDAAMEPVGHEVYNSAREAIENLLPRFQAPQAKQAEPILPPMQPQPSVDLQNRDRSRAASLVQMSDIARNPDYMRLGPSRTPDSGAPMVFAVGDQLEAIAPENFGRQDVAVMSDGQRVPFRYAVVDATKVNPSNFADGRQNPEFSSTTPGTIKALNNGRTAGVRAAHEMGTAGEYVAGMQADEAMHGIPADVIARTPNPMLVRVYSDAANTANMAAKSQGQGLGMSPAELARQDAPLMDSSVLGVYEPGEITSAANRDFVRAFIGKLQAAGQDVAGMMTGDGQLSQDGRKRIQAALMQAAYGDSDIVEEMFDATDTDLKAIGEALKTMAGQWANMRDSAKLGAINPQTDITQNLIQAIGLIRKARRDGTMLYDLVNQPDLMTGETPDATTVGVLRMFYSGQYMTRAVGKDKLTKSLSDYVTAAMATSADPGMFGDVVTAGEILATINPITEGQSDAEAQPEEGRGQPAGSGDPGVGAGEARTAVGRQRAGESGPGATADRGRESGQDAAPEAQQQVDQGDPRAEEGDGAAAARARAGQQEGADGRAAAAEGRAGAADGQAVKAKKPKNAANPKSEPDALPADQVQQLERDFRAFPTQILNNLLERGEAAKLYKAAGVKGASAFGDLAMDDKAAAYVKFVQQGGKPVENLPKDYNAWVKSEERAAEVRRLQSDRVVRQENGKPFKSKTSAQQYQERYDLTGTHEVVAVDGGFELRQLSPAAQAELKRKAEGRESYTEAQAAVAEEMGIGQTPDGEWDATDEQFDEMERRVQARMRGEPAEPKPEQPKQGKADPAPAPEPEQVPAEASRPAGAGAGDVQADPLKKAVDSAYRVANGYFGRDFVSRSIQNDWQRLLDAAGKKDVQALSDLESKYRKDEELDGLGVGTSGAGPGKVKQARRGAAPIPRFAREIRQAIVAELSKNPPNPNTSAEPVQETTKTAQQAEAAAKPAAPAPSPAPAETKADARDALTAQENDDVPGSDVRVERDRQEPAPMASRGRPGAMTEAAVRQVADTIKARWTQAPDVVVVQNMQDMRVPEAARLEDARQRAAGATGVPRGFYHRGTVYLVADGLKSVTDAAEALFHEALGHYGLRAVFGGHGLNAILDQIAMARPDLMKPKAKQYGKDLKVLKQRREVAEEVLAELSQVRPDIGFVKRAIAAIRTWLRQNVPYFKDLALTDAEIINSFILPARNWVERGERADGSAPDIRFSRSTDPSVSGLPDTIEVDGAQRPTRNSAGQPIHPTEEGIRNFWRWFGSSRVADEQGRPLVVYHGTVADFDAFDNAKTGANDRGLWGRGHYFSASVDNANSYALRQGDGARLIPSYVSIKNPLILKTGSDLVTRLPDGTNTRDLIGPNLDGAKIKQLALDGGHDGVIQIRPNGLIGDLVAYSPEQIKSAINRGTFDAGSPDIRYSVDAGNAITDTASYEPASPEHQRLADTLAGRLYRAYGRAIVLDAVAPGSGAVGGRGRELAAVSTVARRLFGHEVVFVRFKGKPLFNGAMSTAIPDVLFINADATKPMMAVLGHELLHHLKRTNDGIYNTLNDRLNRLKKNERDYLHRLEVLYGRQGAKAPANWDEELNADIVGDFFMDPEFWADMAKGQPGLFRRVANAIIKFLDDVAAKIADIRPFGTDQYLTDIAAARAAVADAMRQFSGAQVGAMTSQSEGINLSVSGLPETITVDGKQRPTRNSEGQLIHPTEEGIRNFWRWFGSSRVVDEQGRPLVSRSSLVAARKSAMLEGRMDGGSSNTTGNRGTFDPENPDIRFSRSTLGNTPPTPPQNPSAWQKLKAKALELTSQDAIESLIYEYQEKNIDLKRLRDHIKELGGTITDLNDAYLGEELYHKRLAKRTQDFLSEELKPLLADMRARGVDMPTLERYLHARHAPEANRVLAERNPNAQMIEAGKAKAQAEVKALEVQLQRARAHGTATKAIEQALEQAMAERDRWTGAQAFKGTDAERLSLSGMSDAEAAAFMGGLPAGQKVHLEALAARVDAMQAKTLEALEKYGLMDKATLDAWRSTYQFYVPLHRDEAHPDAVSHPIGQGFSTKGDASKRRTGSNEKVTNILAHIAMQREAALTRGEKNRVAKKLYLMAAQNPDPETWSVDKPPMMKTVDRETGFVRTTVDPTYRNKPNVVMVRIGGKDHAITFNERNPKAVRMAQSIKGADVGDLNAFESIMGKATRWLSSVNTQYNPIFGIINFARDVQAAILQLSTTPLKGQERAVAAYVPAALKGIYAEVRSRRKGQPRGTGQWAKLWEDMQDEGGTTGYRELFITPDERVQALTKELNALERGKASEAAHAVVDWLSDYNETMENAVRLAAYKVALDQGMSKERAASLAKNLTVNFNRRGRQTARLGAYYAFLNAAIQGTTRMVETLRGPLGRKIMLGGVVLGAVNALIGMAMMGGDDDEEDNWEKIPDFVKERSLIVPLGREDYLAIPMPLGYHVFPNLGRKAVEMMMHDDPTKGVGSHIAEMLRITLDAFNPLGGSENLAQMVTPTPFDPAVALMMNRDWTGKPIYREDNSNLDPTPGHQRTKDTASAFSKAVSEALNKITGGTDYQPGAVSVTPDQIDYVIGQITGGLGREILKLENTITAPLTGDELPAYKIPLVGRLYGNTRGPANNAELFYEHVRELNQIENEIRGRARDGGDVAGYMAEEPLSALVGMGNAAENQIRKLRQYRAEVVRRAEPGYQDEVKRINEQMGEVMKMLNQEVRRAKMEAADAP